MASILSILKNVIKLNTMHVEKCEISKQQFEQYGEVIEREEIDIYARPYRREQCRCPVCRRECVQNGYKYETDSKWRAPNLNGVPVYIRYRPHRILCPEHGALNEYIPWADGDSRFTAEFNNEAAWLACQMNKSAIALYLSINWRTVGNCVKAAHDRLEPDISARLRGLRRICVDETSYQKGHQYITVVYDMDRSRVVWIHERHGLSVFEEFCNLLTEEERRQIEVVAGDGARWIDTCVKQYFPNAVRCLDPFHIVEWANKALDEVRIATAAKATREYNKRLDEFRTAEAKELQAAQDAMKARAEALEELASMPVRGRPSKRKRELLEFLRQLDEEQNIESDPKRKSGRGKTEQFTEEHQKILDELQGAAKRVKGAGYALGHNPENCTQNQSDTIELIANSYPDLYRAYQLKEKLRIILHMQDAGQAAFALAEWIAEAGGSNLAPMVKLSEKIQRHSESILNSVKTHSNSSKSESTNTTIKGLIKIARGFRNTDNMIALVYLKCSALVIPLSNRPQPSPAYAAKLRECARARKQTRSEERRSAV